MTPTDPDYATPYRQLRERVTALVREHEADVDKIAPATPEWRVRDVLSHLVGVCDDVVSGNLESVATDAWTGAQVDKRRDVSVDELLDEWAERGPAVEQVMSAAPMPAFGQMVFDAVTHEHDIRGALGKPGARDSSAMTVAFEWATDGFAGPPGSRGGVYTFVTDYGTKTVGEGERTFTLRAPRFEIIRALTGRRSERQVRAYDWGGEPPWFVLNELFHPPVDDLIE